MLGMESAQASEILRLLTETISAIDLTRAMVEYPKPEDLASRMLESLPDAIITEPLIGPCYSTAALARWRKLTRQAITHQRKVGTLFAVEHKSLFYFPSAQFDRRGRQLSAFRDVWSDFQKTGGTPLEFAVWLQTLDPETGATPASVIASAPDLRTTEQRLIDDFEPVIIQPPSGTTGGRSGRPSSADS